MERPEICLQNDLEELLRFEKLLLEISTQFISLPAGMIDSGIEDAQRRICECLGLDLSSLWQRSSEKSELFTLTHLYSPAEFHEALPRQLNGPEMFPYQYQKMMQGEILAFSLEDLPPEAERDKETRRRLGIKSSVSLPLSAGSRPIFGILTFSTLQVARSWPEEIVNRLTLIGQIFCNALARKQSEEDLRESEARMRLAADSAGAILWDLEIDSGRIWTTTKGKEYFGFAPDSEMTFESFLRVILPVDRVKVQGAVMTAIRSGTANSAEFRIKRPDGSIRWVLARGQPFSASSSRMMGVSIDITGHKVFEERLIGSEARLAAAIEVARLGFYEMDEDWAINFLDDRMRVLLGVSPADERNSRAFWLAHIHPDDLPPILEKSRQVLEGGVDLFAGEYRYLHPERGVIWLQHNSRVLERDAAGRAVRIIGVMRDITERKEKEQRLEESRTALSYSRKDLRRLAGKLISTQEKELRRLSRELHDDLTQRLAVLAIEAGKVERVLETMELPLPDQMLLRVSRIKEQLISVSEDVHQISRQLHPTILDDLGLVRAMESECSALQLRENLAILFRHEDIPDRIAKDIALCLYRIVQEGLKNIVQHSGAASCEVDLHGGGDALCLTVKDEGRGFDRVAVRKKAGLGITSMRERAQLVGGEFTIDSRPGGGTVIRVRVPLKWGEA